MSNTQPTLWETILEEAQKMARAEPALAAFFKANILDHADIGSASAALLASKLASNQTPAAMLLTIFNEGFANPKTVGPLACDLEAIYQRDSACQQYASAFLYYKGFHALTAWRVAHHLWGVGRQALALLLQNHISVVFGVDIHPAASIGKGVMFDHATGIVVGETAVIEDCVSILQSVTLGGTGKVAGDRHPKVRRGVLIGPGAKIIGNIEIGKGSKITAASVVLQDIPAHSLVAGVPAEVIGQLHSDSPAEQMDQGLNCCKN